AHTPASPSPAPNPDTVSRYPDSSTAARQSTSHRSSPHIARTRCSTSSLPNQESLEPPGTGAPADRPAPRAASPQCLLRANTDTAASANSRPSRQATPAPAHSARSRAQTPLEDSHSNSYVNTYGSPPARRPPTASTPRQRPYFPPVFGH